MKTTTSWPDYIRHHIIIICCVLIGLFLPQSIDASTYSITRNVGVSAYIGTGEFTLFGYTSPFAKVILEGQGIFDETYADKNGYFEFYNSIAPLNSPETCLTAIDTNGRITTPFCLPRFPLKRKFSIGPILLPPTLSINQPSYDIGDYGALEGRAAPGSDVEISIYKSTDVNNTTLMAHTDPDGNYSMTIPTSKKNALQIFSRNFYKNLESEKSNTLHLDIFPLLALIIQWLKTLFTLLKSFLLPLTYFLEALALCGIMIYIWNRKKKTYPLALRPDHELEDPNEYQPRGLQEV